VDQWQVEAEGWRRLLLAVRSVRVVQGSSFDPRHRTAQLTVFLERDSEAVEALRDALVLDQASERYAWMTPGDPALALFAAGGEFLNVITYLTPDHVRSPMLSGDTRLGCTLEAGLGP